MLNLSIDKTYLDRREPLIISVSSDRPHAPIRIMQTFTGLPDYELVSGNTDGSGNSKFSVQWDNSGRKTLKAVLESGWIDEKSGEVSVQVTDGIYDDQEWAAEGSPYYPQITVPDEKETVTDQYDFLTDPAIQTVGGLFETGANVAGAAEGASGAAAEGITEAMEYLKYALIAVMAILVISVALQVMPSAIGKRAVS